MAFMTILPMNTPLWLGGIQIQIHPISAVIAGKHVNTICYTTNGIFGDLANKARWTWICIA